MIDDQSHDDGGENEIAASCGSDEALPRTALRGNRSYYRLQFTVVGRRITNVSTRPWLRHSTEPGDLPAGLAAAPSPLPRAASATPRSHRVSPRLPACQWVDRADDRVRRPGEEGIVVRGDQTFLHPVRTGPVPDPDTGEEHQRLTQFAHKPCIRRALIFNLGRRIRLDTEPACPVATANVCRADVRLVFEESVSISTFLALPAAIAPLGPGLIERLTEAGHAPSHGRQMHCSRSAPSGLGRPSCQACCETG